MNRSTDHRVGLLQRNGERGLLRGSLKGLEKESLRVTEDGRVAQTPHPAALGSALCHPAITTDYSEALLELVTAPHQDAASTLDSLEALHHFVYHNIGDELLWVTSMPCIVGGDTTVPIAEYGSSNVGRMKHVYRRGLDWRYGRTMQAISGLHFNYSVSDAFLGALQEADGDAQPAQRYRSEIYLGLIRNFQRYGWIVPYLFGASPAICRSFTGGQNLDFEPFGQHTYYAPWATSLRMSDIGYKNNAQAGLAVSYNDLDAYVASLKRAMSTSDPEYERIGRHVGGEWRQLTTNVLQIENEYYSFVRPKAVAESGEKPTNALLRAGVEYVEIRALDLNPFEPLGINQETLDFLEILLLFCLLQDSPGIDAHEQGWINHNQGLVARRGRDPHLRLTRGDGHKVLVTQWARELFEALSTPAELLDELRDGTPYRDTLARLQPCAQDQECAPSARVIAEMREHGEEFTEFAIRWSEHHARRFREIPLGDTVRARLEAAAEESLAEQRRLEAADDLPFEAYLERYFAQP